MQAPWACDGGARGVRLGFAAGARDALNSATSPGPISTVRGTPPKPVPGSFRGAHGKFTLSSGSPAKTREVGSCRAPLFPAPVSAGLFPCSGWERDGAFSALEFALCSRTGSGQRRCPAVEAGTASLARLGRLPGAPRVGAAVTSPPRVLGPRVSRCFLVDIAESCPLLFLSLDPGTNS